MTRQEILQIPKNRILVYDTETTGFYAGHDEILQFSACDGDGNELLNTYIRPTHKKSWPEAATVNGITPAMVKNCPTMEELRSQIQVLFDNADLLIAYNNSFDDRFLQAAGVAVKSNAIGSVDVMMIFSEIYGEWNSYYGNYKWQKLTTAAAYYDFDWSKYGAHNSMGDVLATLHVFNKIMEIEE